MPPVAGYQQKKGIRSEVEPLFCVAPSDISDHSIYLMFELPPPRKCVLSPMMMVLRLTNSWVSIISIEPTDIYITIEEQDVWDGLWW